MNPHTSVNMLFKMNPITKLDQIQAVKAEKEPGEISSNACWDMHHCDSEQIN